MSVICFSKFFVTIHADINMSSHCSLNVTVLLILFKSSHCSLNVTVLLILFKPT